MVKWQALGSALLVSMALQLPTPARADSGRTDGWQWPLSPASAVAAPFEAPEQPWGPGHRGIDLLGTVGQPVLAIGDGTITFAGMVAGRGVVVVDHGRLRSTYEPVTARVLRGDQVTAGQVIATLAAVRSHCPPAACLHLGVRRGDVYLDPLSLLGAQHVRLKPLGGMGVAAGPIRAGSAKGVRHQGSPTSARGSPSAVGLTASAVGGTAAGVAAMSLVGRSRGRRRSGTRPA